MFQTYATKVAGKEEVLTMYGQSRLFDRRSLAFAIAVVPIGPEAGTYMVHTLEKACEDASFTIRTKIELEKLPGQPAVEWTRPLNRRLQRLFGWGRAAGRARASGGKPDQRQPSDVRADPSPARRLEQRSAPGDRGPQ